MCLLCGPVTVRYGRPFTNGCCYEHLNSEFNKNKARHHEHLIGKMAAAAAKDGLVSEKTMLELKLFSRAQTSLVPFLVPREKANVYLVTLMLLGCARNIGQI